MCFILRDSLQVVSDLQQQQQQQQPEHILDANMESQQHQPQPQQQQQQLQSNSSDKDHQQQQLLLQQQQQQQQHRQFVIQYSLCNCPHDRKCNVLISIASDTPPATLPRPLSACLWLISNTPAVNQCLPICQYIHIYDMYLM